MKLKFKQHYLCILTGNEIEIGYKLTIIILRQCMFCCWFHSNNLINFFLNVRPKFN